MALLGIGFGLVILNQLKNLPPHACVVVLITDGQPNCGGEEPGRDGGPAAPGGAHGP